LVTFFQKSNFFPMTSPKAIARWKPCRAGSGKPCPSGARAKKIPAFAGMTGGYARQADLRFGAGRNLVVAARDAA
jgi:hypothetical protein